MNQLLEHIGQYVSLSIEEANLLTSELHPIKVSKNDKLLEAGKICKCNYFVIQGCLRMYFIKESGLQHTTQFAIENWWLSDYLSFLTQSESQFSIEPIEPSKVIAMDSDTADYLTAEIPQLNRYFSLVTQRAYASAQMRLRYLHEFSGEDLYDHFTSRFPEFLQRVPQYMMASYLGFTPEYYSRLRKKNK